MVNITKAMFYFLTLSQKLTGFTCYILIKTIHFED